MTDNEIIKAKVIIKNLHTYCFLTQATYKKTGFEFCENDFNRLNNLIDLINRQQVEIERLKEVKSALENDIYNNEMNLSHLEAEIEGWKEAFNNLDKIARPNLAYVENAKSEAIREFAKFIIDKSKKGVIYDSDIPDYVKEMVGEDNG